MNDQNKPMTSTAPSAASARRPRNRDATIQAVLESAQRLFGSKGYDHTSLVDIAAETGLSPRGVILHFSSKADIAAELMFRNMRARAASFRPDPSGTDPVSRITSFFDWLAEDDRKTFINFPALWAFAARWSPKIESTVEQATTELLAPVRQALEEGVAQGELRRCDTDTACDMLWISYLAGLRRAAIRGGQPADALADVHRTLQLLRQ